MRPDACAFVTATGIVSFAADDHGLHSVSLFFALVAASGLAIVFADLDIVFWATAFWVLGIGV